MKRRSPIPARPYMESRVPLELASRKAIKRTAGYAATVILVSIIVYVTTLLYHVGGRP